jgi:hypothetical protein
MRADKQAPRQSRDCGDQRTYSNTIARDRLLIVLLILGLHALMMWRYPIIYGGDTVLRLVNFPKIHLGYQLPLLQILIHYALSWFYDPKSIFLLMALVSGAACAGLHALTFGITRDRRAAWLAAIFYATHPFILYYSRVPYQEPLLLAAVFWGFYFLFRPASRAGLLLTSMFFGAACLTRYEGWIASLSAALYIIWLAAEEQTKLRFRYIIKVALLFGWGPALWIIWNKGLSPGGTFVLDLGFHWARLYRSYFVAKSALWWTESAVVLLALVGIARCWLDVRSRRDRRIHLLMGFLILFLAAMVFSGHGIEPDAERMVTEREAFIPIGLLVLWAGIGGSMLLTNFQTGFAHAGWQRLVIPLLILFMAAGYSLNRAMVRMSAAHADPELKTAYDVAQYLAVLRARALVFAAPMPDEGMQNFLQNAEKSGGQRGLLNAQRILDEMETTPLDYQRILMYSWMGKDQILSGEILRGFDRLRIESTVREMRIDCLVLLSDFSPVAEHEKMVVDLYAEGRNPDLEIGGGAKAAKIYFMR